MAVVSLSLAESLRPWRSAGISHVLSTDFSDGENTLAHSALASGEATEFQQANDLLPTAPVAAHSPKAFAIPDTSAISKGSPIASALHEKRHYWSAAGDVQTSSNDMLLTEEELPINWRLLLPRMKPAPILWTYSELGLDLGGQGDPTRSALLKRMIARLNFPKGTSTFWPLWLVGDNETYQAEKQPVSTHAHINSEPRSLSANPYFLYGIKALQAKVVVMLGMEAVSLSGLNMELTTYFTQYIYQGLLYVLLPPCLDLSESQGLSEKSCIYLASALTGIPSLNEALLKR